MVSYLIEVKGEPEQVIKELKALSKKVKVCVHVAEPVIELAFVESILHPKKEE